MTQKILLIGLDAADPDLIEKYMTAGLLPNIQKLKQQGVYARIGAPDDHLVGLPWPTFYTGKKPGNHGVYHYLQWNPDKMKTERINNRWLPLTPFWQEFGKNDPRAIVIDVPLTPGPRPFNGIEINGWGSHEIITPLASYPKTELAWIEKNIGPAPSFGERYGRFSEKELQDIRDRLIFLTQQVGKLSQCLITREPWDLFMVVFSATHRAGHQLWNAGIDAGKSEDNGSGQSPSLQSVYSACDAAVGDILTNAGKNVSVILFSLHGMGFNQSRTEILNEMVDKIISQESGQGATQRPGLLSQIRRLVPSTFRHAVKRRLPHHFQDRLTSFWRMGGADWHHSPVITLLGDYDGYLQVNLKGREAEGIVNPGKEYDAWVEKIIAGVSSFTDADSGKPIVQKVLKKDELNFSGDYVNRLPDLVVQWAQSPSNRHRKLHSPIYGTVDWPTPGRNPEGRTGNHRPQGFFIARGERFSPGTVLKKIEIIDLAPTILDILGCRLPWPMEGKVLSGPNRPGR